MSKPTEEIDLGAVLQLAVLMPLENGLFNVVGKLPNWWNDELGSVNSDHDIKIESPFLVGFLHEAAEVWNAGQDTIHASPFFELSNPSPLQAFAIRERGQNILVVRDLKVIDHWLAEVLRKSRRHMIRQEYERSTHRKEVADIAADRDEAKRRDELKSRVLAHVSHEIRTPLTTVLGMTDLAQKNPADAAKHLTSISFAAQQLLRMGSDLLDLSKMQVARLELDNKPIDLTKFLDSLGETWAMHCAKKGLSFGIHRDSHLPKILIADDFRLRQIVENLLGNAVKYTRRGSVKLKVTSQPRGAIRFEVVDTGCGISKADLPQIFEEFAQVDPSKQIRQKGAGLGMAIASRLARLMGSEIQVESTVGEGSRFWLDVVPQEESLNSEERNNAAPDEPARLHQPAKILIAEDHLLNRSLIVEILETAGATAAQACNGREAVEVWRSEPLDAIVMDCQMPVMSGIEAIRQIRETEENKEVPFAPIPIVVLTAHAMATELEQFMDEGADACVTKPCEPTALVSVLNDLLQRRKTSVSTRSH